MTDKIRTADFYREIGELTDENVADSRAALGAIGLGGYADQMMRIEQGVIIEMTGAEGLVVCPYLRTENANMLEFIFRDAVEDYRTAHPDS